MSRRPRGHQLEDESRREFQLLLPPAWVYRSESPDYGVDAQVEIFDQEGNSTGYRFLVQLKATDKVSYKSARRVRLKRKTAEYFQSQDVPVLIASYHAPTRSFYARWFHQYDPYYDRGGTNAITFTFDDQHLWNLNTSGQIYDDLILGRKLLTGTLRPPFSLSITFLEESIGGLSKSRIISGIHDVLETIPGIFSIFKDKTPKDVLQVTLRSEEVEVDLARRYCAVLHIKKAKLSESKFPSDILILAAILLGQGGYEGLTARVSLKCARRASIIENPKIFMRLALLLAQGEHVQEALTISEELVSEYGPTWAADVLSLTALGRVDSMSTAQFQFLQVYLLRRIELAEQYSDKSLLAIAHYNFGNFSRRHLGPEVAFYHYQRARHIHPEYNNRVYFRTELAGILFELKRFPLSAKLYQTCLDNSERSDVEALYADALMFSGQYWRAREVFANYLSKSESADAEWRLKLWVLNYLSSTIGIKGQRRRIREAENIIAGEDIWDGPANLDVKRVLDLDALCALFWFNYGVTQNKLGDFESAGIAFVFASVCNKYDDEALANAWGLTFNLEHLHSISALILIYGYQARGSDFINRCAELVNQNKRDDLKMKMRETLKEFSPTDSPAIARFIGPNHQYDSYKVEVDKGFDLTKLSS